ncbi:MAG: SusC/RagA family TonB-linked outer membrane protein [Prolixibacteraceae bacterium]|nr:SusC/RagA family TonB-linked outer membrane protein [Prolixibacteraceae bacterium]
MEMIKKIPYYTLIITALIVFGVSLQKGYAQDEGIPVTGKVLESGTAKPLQQVVVSVSSTGDVAVTNEQGEFTIKVPDLQSELIFDLPGYNKRKLFLLGRESIVISMVPSEFRSFDNDYNNPLGVAPVKDAIQPLTAIYSEEIDKTSSTSYDQALQGKIAGLNIVEHSGMPGHKTLLNLRGFSSLYGKSNPLLFIDGMIHEYGYATNSLMEGFAINPMDVMDIDDIADLSVIKNGEAYLGAAGSNGVIFINTEQKSEASTVIDISGYAGIALMPKKLNVLDASQYRNYLGKRLSEEGLSNEEVNNLYPWLNGGEGSDGYNKYNNSTSWQDEVFKPGVLQKYHIFLKGGDDIATYNISAGYMDHQGMSEETRYSRFNLRINGKINISNKFSLTPNAKLSLADSYLPNQGYSVYKNPLTSSLLIPPIMTPYARDEATGEQLPYLDDVGFANISNPVAIVLNGTGTSRNYHFLSSVKAIYKFNEHLYFSDLIGINFNNARENIFIPDKGIVDVGIEILDTPDGKLFGVAQNRPGDLINEFRSTQNHAVVGYTNQTNTGHIVDAKVGMRYMANSYKYDKGLDLNTPSDDFKNLGQGSTNNFLRTSTGDNRELIWISYFGNANYNFRNKYYVNVNMSYDANSAVNTKNRYNFFPSVSAAWRASSEKFLSSVSWIDDLKLRALWSQTGNMYSSVYDFSKLYYIEDRLGPIGVPVREVIPNEDLELERKSTLNAGIDISLFKQATGIHVDYYMSSVNNMIIEQKLPTSLGYTSYFDNGGVLDISGLEFSIDQKVIAGPFSWVISANMATQVSGVSALSFLNDDIDKLVTPVEGGAEYITSVGNPLNAFYGYKTEGIFQSDGEASKITGPKGVVMQAGDIKFWDSDGNNIINEEDKTIIGDPNPDFFGGLYTTLRYKAFELKASLNYSVGNDVYNYVRYKAESMDGLSNQLSTVLDRWSSDNTGASMPRAAFGDPTGNTVFSDRWIEDGSYLRLNQLTLAYHLPETSWYKGIAIYVTATNLFTLTSYSGYDPETMYMNNPFYMGIDYGQMPQARSIILGLKLDL